MKNEGYFRMQGKQFFLTYPQCGQMTTEQVLTATTLLGEISEYIIAQEKHLDGNRHIHAYIYFKRKHVITSPTYFDIDGRHGDYRTVRNKWAVMKYVTKDKDYITNIDLTNKIKAASTKTKYINDAILVDGLTGITNQVEEGNISFKDVRRYEEGYHRYKQLKEQVVSIFTRRCYWIYGEPGIGKSYWVRSRYPLAYIKAQNKWWDGYSTQDVVLLDDLDSSSLGHLLKIWSDSYSFMAEAKGTSFIPAYTVFFVTSNYRPADLWKNDPVIVAAIERRFTFCTIDRNRDLIDTDGEIVKI